VWHDYFPFYTIQGGMGIIDALNKIFAEITSKMSIKGYKMNFFSVHKLPTQFALKV
jgi:hypothetical protein